MLFYRFKRGKKRHLMFVPLPPQCHTCIYIYIYMYSCTHIYVYHHPRDSQTFHTWARTPCVESQGLIPWANSSTPRNSLPIPPNRPQHENEKKNEERYKKTQKREQEKKWNLEDDSEHIYNCKHEILNFFSILASRTIDSSSFYKSNSRRCQLFYFFLKKAANFISISSLGQSAISSFKSS